jgi:hypothetical protein
VLYVPHHASTDLSHSASGQCTVLKMRVGENIGFRCALICQILFCVSLLAAEWACHRDPKDAMIGECCVAHFHLIHLKVLDGINIIDGVGKPRFLQQSRLLP